jgi:bifunctional non-homologous end joining protein LigD
MIKSELLHEISKAEVERLILNPNFGVQEKFNGERRTICKEGERIRNWNREGEEGKPLPASLLRILRAHPVSAFVIDVELVKAKLKILDALIIDTFNLFDQEYVTREEAAHTAFDNFHADITVVFTARTMQEKMTLMQELILRNAEGACFKNMQATFKQGRAGQHFKFKFWKEVDAVVMAPSYKGHEAVEIGVYDAKGKLQRISGCALKSRIKVSVGDVVSVKYLYATRDRHIVQPSMLRVRTDKKPNQCTIDQLVVNENFI